MTPVPDTATFYAYVASLGKDVTTRVVFRHPPVVELDNEDPFFGVEAA